MLFSEDYAENVVNQYLKSGFPAPIVETNYEVIVKHPHHKKLKEI